MATSSLFIGRDDAAIRLQRIRGLARLMDARFRLPVVGPRFGLDSILGLVPVVGDTLSWGIATYIVAEARALGAPRSLIARMGFNICVDWAVGLVPVVGDLLDVGVKANLRNVELLEEDLRRRGLLNEFTIDAEPVGGGGDGLIRGG